jgi:hypothetical protein
VKPESRIVEANIDLVAMRNPRQDARDEKTDTGTTRSEFKLELPGQREEEETKNEKKLGDMKNGNRNVKSHVKGSVMHKGRGSWMRLGNRKGWPRDEGNSDGKQSCSRKEIVWVNWRKNEPARENSVSVIESKRGKPKGGWRLVRVSCLRTRRIFLCDPSLPPTLEDYHRGVPT